MTVKVCVRSSNPESTLRRPIGTPQQRTSHQEHTRGRDRRGDQHERHDSKRSPVAAATWSDCRRRRASRPGLTRRTMKHPPCRPPRWQRAQRACQSMVHRVSRTAEEVQDAIVSASHVTARADQASEHSKSVTALTRRPAMWIGVAPSAVRVAIPIRDRARASATCSRRSPSTPQRRERPQAVRRAKALAAGHSASSTAGPRKPDGRPAPW